jgi:hypothetical protein
VDKQRPEGDRLYLIAENLAQDFSLFPAADAELPLRGVLSRSEILRYKHHLSGLDVDEYIEAVVAPAEDPKRQPAPEAIRQLGKVVSENSDGPYYDAVVEIDFGEGVWRCSRSLGGQRQLDAPAPHCRCRFHRALVSAQRANR